MTHQIWWTEADTAELALLVHELVRVAFVHRERCPTCSGERGILYCASMGHAIEAVIEWRDGRILRSKAAWLRARETVELGGRAVSLAPSDAPANLE